MQRILSLPGFRPLALLLSAVVLTAGCSGGASEGDAASEPSEQPVASAQESPAASESPAGSPSPSESTSAEEEAADGTDEAVESGGAEPSAAATPAPPPNSVLGLAEQKHRGDRLRLGAVREQTAAYTSYDITYRSRSVLPKGEESYRISGVLNVPTGKGPFPAVVLAHGYIDPAIYQRGQGMTRERGYLAARGYVALHVDYRNHAESDDDPQVMTRLRLGYSADVINAVKALRKSDVPVDDDRVALFGRSMGGGVILKALVAEPGLVQAAAPWASVSSLEAQNFDQFIRPDAQDSSLASELENRFRLPGQNPKFWRQNSSRPYFDRITEPVLMVHGNFDDTCPPEWARATQRALVDADVDSQLEWYDDGHAFGPAFNAAMDRTVRFFDNQLG